MLALLALIAVLLGPACARANPALPTVRLHLRLEPAVGPPGSPPTSTLLLELAWSFDPRRFGRRSTLVRDLNAEPGFGDPLFHEPGELPWLAFEQTGLDDPGDLP